MKFEEDAIYHIYNRSNEITFRTRGNYLFFLHKIKLYLYPYCHILAWCLMPNHFHILIQAKKEGIHFSEDKHRGNIQLLSLKIGLLISSYTQAYNKMFNRRGRLFSHKTAAKILNDTTVTPVEDFGKIDYVTTCLLYIHQNPLVAGLVDDMSDWEMSSFNDFAEKRNGSLINKELAFSITSLNSQDFVIQSDIYLDESIVKEIF